MTDETPPFPSRVWWAIQKGARRRLARCPCVGLPSMRNPALILLTNDQFIDLRMTADPFELVQLDDGTFKFRGIPVSPSPDATDGYVTVAWPIPSPVRLHTHPELPSRERLPLS